MDAAGLAGAFNGFKNKAGDYVNDKEKTSNLLNEAMKKAKENKGPLDEAWENIQLLFGVVKDWTSGEYRDIPVGSLIAIIAALLYFVSPIDLIPDFVPGIGFADDIAVVGLVIKQVSSDLKKYKTWKQSR